MYPFTWTLFLSLFLLFSLIDVVQELRAVGLQLDLAPAKLKQGNGEAVCLVLRALSDYALRATRFEFKKPVFGADKYVENTRVSFVSHD